ncbi:hypothetical protein [Neobacillus niacini]|uniref:hypothetical protein n=1 Tax=Neobacillus niacini TaxID=86668 RepID=UPI0021CB1990|nr:hypothetical protein [Neobacillus niacini]MCM3764642.1 hypothetical protein [Neobacillus niacini]
MEMCKQDFIFSTLVSDSTDVKEFIIEFYHENAAESSPIKVTKNFDELIDFLNELEN